MLVSTRGVRWKMKLFGAKKLPNGLITMILLGTVIQRFAADPFGVDKGESPGLGQID